VSVQAAMVTEAVKAQAAGIAEIGKGIANARDQVRQVSAATVEQAKHSRDIVRTVDQVKEQSALIAKAVKEQLLGMDELAAGVKEAASRVRLAAAAGQDQSLHGRSAARELETSVRQAEEIVRALRTQSAGLGTLGENWAETGKVAQQGVRDLQRMAAMVRELIDRSATVRDTIASLN